MSEIKFITGLFSVMFALVAFFISLSLRLKLGPQKDAKKTEERIFIQLVNILIICSILNPILYCVNGMNVAAAKYLLIIVNTACMVFYLLFMFMWMNFVDYKFFHSRSRIERQGKKAFIPLAAMLLLLLVNLPTGILFSINEKNEIDQHPLFLIGIFIQLAYLFYTTLLVKKFKDLYGGLHFFSIKEFVIPFLAGVIFQFVLRDQVFVTLASAIGLTTIYINLLREKVYIDPTSDLYNNYFLTKVFDEIRAGDYDFKSAILFELVPKDAGSGHISMIGETAKAVREVIEKVMPEGCETIYMGNGELLVLTKVNVEQEAAIKMLGEMFKETIKLFGYEDFSVQSSYAFRNDGQSAEEFLRSFGTNEEVAA